MIYYVDFIKFHFLNSGNYLFSHIWGILRLMLTILVQSIVMSEVDGASYR